MQRDRDKWQSTIFTYMVVKDLWYRTRIVMIIFAPLLLLISKWKSLINTERFFKIDNGRKRTFL